MRDCISRRRVLGGLAAISAVGIAGCGEPATEEESPAGDAEGGGGEETEGEAGGTPMETTT